MRARWMIAIGAAVVGMVWLLQGLGVLAGSSFMVGDPLWAIVGGALLAGGVAVGISAWRARRST
jgi:FMN phosphatase YigB (HAD superfamily)